MASLCSEQRVWRELVLFHFTPSQISGAVERQKGSEDESSETDEEQDVMKMDVDWKMVFHKLRRLVTFNSRVKGGFSGESCFFSLCTVPDMRRGGTTERFGIFVYE